MILVAKGPPAVDLLKQTILETLARSLDPEAVPAWSVPLYEAFRELLVAPEGSVPAAALPLIARWDDAGALDSDLGDLLSRLSRELEDRDLPDEYRGQIAVSLLGVSSANPDLVPMVASVLGTLSSSALQRRVIAALGEMHVGLIAREHQNSIVLTNIGGEVEISRDDIVSMRSTGKPLMPEGYEALGAGNLRDLITYLGAGDTPYRFLDLSSTFTVDTTQGIYVSREATDQTLHFTNFGAVEVEGIPFEIAHPSSTHTGNNAVVLKGGHGFARTLPQEVEIAAGIAASKLHILGGVAGWGYPFGNASEHDVPALRLTVHYEDAGTEEFVMRNGREFADYNGTADVPGSAFAEGIVRGGQQVRWFTLELSGRETSVESIVLSSFDNHVAPTIVSITVELPAN